MLLLACYKQKIKISEFVGFEKKRGTEPRIRKWRGRRIIANWEVFAEKGVLNNDDFKIGGDYRDKSSNLQNRFKCHFKLFRSLGLKVKGVQLSPPPSNLFLIFFRLGFVGQRAGCENEWLALLERVNLKLEGRERGGGRERKGEMMMKICFNWMANFN